MWERLKILNYCYYVVVVMFIMAVCWGGWQAGGAYELYLRKPIQIINNITNATIVAVKKVNNTPFQLVIAHYKENIDWLEPFVKLYNTTIYTKSITDVPEKYKKIAKYITPNLGQEVPCYLKYILDNYDYLPVVTGFFHAHLMSWHSQLSNAQIIERVDFEKIHDATGFVNVNLREHVEIFGPNDERFQYFTKYWDELFKPAFFGKEVHSTIRFRCCGQFYVHRDRILLNKYSDYERWYNFSLSNREKDYISSRIFEYLWALIFGSGWDNDISYHDVMKKGY